MKRVLITGANGFIGKKLTKKLLETNIVDTYCRNLKKNDPHFISDNHLDIDIIVSKHKKIIYDYVINLFRQNQGYQQVRLLEHWDNNQKHGLFEGFDRFGNKTFKDDFKYGLRIKHRIFDKTKTISFDRKKEGIK